MTREQANMLGWILGAVGALGGWVVTLPSFSLSSLTPATVGGLMMIIGGLGASGTLIKSPSMVRNLPMSDPPPAISESVKTDRHIEADGKGVERKTEIKVTDSKIGG